LITDVPFEFARLGAVEEKKQVQKLMSHWGERASLFVTEGYSVEDDVTTTKWNLW